MKRFFSGMLAALLALIILMTSALAADNGLFGFGVRVNENKDQNGKTTGGNVDLMVYSDQGAFTKTEVSYLKDGSSVNVDVSTRNWSNSGYATTHVYVVDVAAAATGSDHSKSQYRYGHRIWDVQTTLEELISALPSGDNAVVVPTNQKFSGRYLTNDDSVLMKAVEDLAFDEKAEKKLASTLKDVAANLNSISGVNDRKIVYVFSNGYTEDLSKSRLADTFKQQGIAVYTIAYQPAGSQKNNKEKNLETFKDLALNSAGGIYCEAPYNDGGAGNNEITDDQLADIVNAIAEHDYNFQVLNFQPEAGMENVASFTLRQGGAMAEISLSMSNRDAISRIVNGNDLDIWVKIWEFLKANWLLCTLGISVVALIVVLLIILIKRGKSNKEEPNSEFSSEEPDNPTVGPDNPTVGPDQPLDPNGGMTQPVAEQNLNIKMDRITQGDVSINIKKTTASDAILVGRVPECQIIFSGADTVRMSRKHAKLQYQPNGMMMIENLSGNGTKINNEKINRPTILQQNDLVTFGDVTVRISWTMGK